MVRWWCSEKELEHMCIGNALCCTTNYLCTRHDERCSWEDAFRVAEKKNDDEVQIDGSGEVSEFIISPVRTCWCTMNDEWVCIH